MSSSADRSPGLTSVFTINTIGYSWFENEARIHFGKPVGELSFREVGQLIGATLVQAASQVEEGGDHGDVDVVIGGVSGEDEPEYVSSLADQVSSGLAGVTDDKPVESIVLRVVDSVVQEPSHGERLAGVQHDPVDQIVQSFEYNLH